MRKTRGNERKHQQTLQRRQKKHASRQKSGKKASGTQPYGPSMQPKNQSVTTNKSNPLISIPGDLQRPESSVRISLSDRPIDNETEYREVRLLAALNPSTKDCLPWVQRVLAGLDSSSYALETHENDLYLIPVPRTGTPPNHRRLKSVVTFHEWQFSSETQTSHEQALYENAEQMGEAIRQQLRQGGSPIVLQIPPGLEDIYHPVLQRVFREEGVPFNSRV